MKNIIFFLLFVPIACANKKQEPIQKPETDSLNVKNLIFTVWSLPFKHKDVIVAQAILETGWFKSKNCTENNNLFGMKRAYTRTTTADTIINGYSHYNNWRLSVIDYYLLQSTTESIYPTHSKADYYRYLDRIYSEVGPEYSSQLKDIIKRIDLPGDIEETTKTTTLHHNKIKNKNVKKLKKHTSKSVRVSRAKSNRQKSKSK